MEKFRAVMEALRADGLAREHNTFEPAPAPASWLSLAHDRHYVDRVLNGSVSERITRDIGLPMSGPVALRARCATGGTVLAGRLALEYGIAANTAGGSHHARWTQGAGFCVFNDVAVAARVLQAEGSVRRVLVVDLDVHQGDGTADIFSNDESVFTFSLHAENNYPDEKRNSDLDIGVPDGMEDGDYLEILADALPGVFARSRPDIVFYNAGVDPHAEDRLGRLALSDRGLAERDQLVIETVRRLGVPLVCVLGGGYMHDIARLARRHTIVHRVAAGLSV